MYVFRSIIVSNATNNVFEALQTNADPNIQIWYTQQNQLEIHLHLKN